MASYSYSIMTTFYSQTTSNTSSTFNWNANTDNYAWSFVPSVSGTPWTLTLNVTSITGTPTCDFWIKADKTAASATHWIASWVTLSAGDNVITLTSGALLTAWVTYWVYMWRTSSTLNVPSISYDTWKANYTVYRSTSSWVDPATLWFSNDIRMTLTSTPNTGGFFMFF